MPPLDAATYLKFQNLYQDVYIFFLKGHWTSSTSSLTFSKKSWDFYTIRSVGMGNDCMPSFTFYIDLLLKIY